MAKKGEAATKKSPAKKGAATAKPVKRLADDKAEKPVVQLRKSSRNAAPAKGDHDPEQNSIAEVAKKVKVTSDSSKNGKKAAAKEAKSKKPVVKAPVEDSDESLEEKADAAEEDANLVEDGKSSADNVKIAKVSIEHCKS